VADWIDAREQRHLAADPPPWTVRNTSIESESGHDVVHDGDSWGCNGVQDADDAAFIAGARNEEARVLAVLKAARLVVETYTPLAYQECAQDLAHACITLAAALHDEENPVG
jgi:hypothetical protein